MSRQSESEQFGRFAGLAKQIKDGTLPTVGLTEIREQAIAAKGEYIAQAQYIIEEYYELLRSTIEPSLQLSSLEQDRLDDKPEDIKDSVPVYEQQHCLVISDKKRFPLTEREKMLYEGLLFRETNSMWSICHPLWRSKK